MGTPAQGEQAAGEIEARIAALASRYQKRANLAVFIEVWHQPLMTVSGAHLISDALRLCGGRNVFGDASMLAPRVSREALLAARPQVLIMSSGFGTEAEQASRWRLAAGTLPAVRAGQLYAIDPALLQRQGPRLIEATQAMCEKLDSARGIVGGGP